MIVTFVLFNTMCTFYGTNNFFMINAYEYNNIYKDN